jgi:hypothetical protein
LILRDDETALVLLFAGIVILPRRFSHASLAVAGIGIAIAT